MKTANEVAKDHICLIIFLNLVVDEEKVVSYQMTKAFSKLEKAQNVLNGRGERTQTFDLTVPNRARYQLRHTPKCDVLEYYTYFFPVWLVFLRHLE